MLIYFPLIVPPIALKLKFCTMTLHNVKKLVELLLIKRNNFIIRPDEVVLLNELQYLLAIDNKLFSGSSTIECKCELNKANIESEIESNICFDCGLPLNVS